MSKGRNEPLRQEREQRGWSQARVAEQIGTDAANVSRWERGYATPSPYFREKLCLLFDTTAQALGFLSNEPSGDEQPPPPLPASLSKPARLPEPLQVQRQHALQGTPGRLSRCQAVLGYLFGWVSGLFLVLLARERFVRFHSLQSTLFFSASNILSLVMLVILAWLAFLKRSSPNWPHVPGDFLEILITLLFVLVNLFTFIVWMVGMLQAWRGRSYLLPFVGSLSDKIVAHVQRETPDCLSEDHRLMARDA